MFLYHVPVLCMRAIFEKISEVLFQLHAKLGLYWTDTNQS
jgi:hypothetical protein